MEIWIALGIKLNLEEFLNFIQPGMPQISFSLSIVTFENLLFIKKMPFISAISLISKTNIDQNLSLIL